MPKTSAGLLMYRKNSGTVEVLLAHPGGPFWRNTDEGSWTIPKGGVEADEDLLACAVREFQEEVGTKPVGSFLPLAPIKQKSGKTVHAWAFEGDLDLATFKSNTYTMEWPPRSGKRAEFPEIDRVAFFDLQTAKRKILPAQADYLKQLQALLGS
jgi:predicted NUDIX family NTP pyrophosphohydrolase